MEFIPQLQPVIAALRQGQWPACPQILLDRAVQMLLREFENDSAAVDAVQCDAMLRLFKQHRQFQVCVQLGELALRAHPDALLLRVPLAQGLIELGRLADAERLIDATLALDLTEQNKLAREMTGLKGRLNKQQVVQARTLTGSVPAADLTDAILAYEGLLKLSRREVNVWGTVNLIALLATAIAEGIGDEDAQQQRLLALREQLVQAVDDAAQAKGWAQLGYWDAASAAEAELAAGGAAQAELWLWRALAAKDVDPFCINSTLRQLREIHVPIAGSNLRAMKAVSRLIEILEAALAEQGLVQISEDLRQRFEQADQALGAGSDGVGADAKMRLEKIFGREKFVGFETLRLIFSQCEAVGRVETKDAAGSFRGVGTGFLFRGSKLSPKLPDELLFMTNAHVISSDVPGALRPQQAWVRFELAARKHGAGYQPHPVQDLLATLPPCEDAALISDQTLDFTVVRLASLPADARAIELSQAVPSMDNQRDPNSEFAAARAYVLGHPEGDGLQISLHDSEIIDIDAASMIVHYRTPTLGGNSGSPVLNAAGKVFALHHAGSEQLMPLNGQALRYPGNEGMTMRAIGAAVTRLLG